MIKGLPLRLSFAAFSAPLAFAALAALALGCADKKTLPPSQTPESVGHSAPVQTTTSAIAPTTAAAPGLETPALRVSNEIARLCNLPKQESTASFDFDSNSIGDQDRSVLSALARCLSDGALKGRGVELTGRADPRGEPEYNMSLGESRADSVRRYLHDMGVQAERLQATSRGEIDATGTDEPGWAHDRRVDIDLAN
jgi:peptidoglycan-associated lipoprotein